MYKEANKKRKLKENTKIKKLKKLIFNLILQLISLIITTGN